MQARRQVPNDIAQLRCHRMGVLMVAGRTILGISLPPQRRIDLGDRLAPCLARAAPGYRQRAP